MKRAIVLFLSLLIYYTSSAQISVTTDERVELTSAVFRLAGIPEYTDGEVASYNVAIDEYFERYKDNALFEYIRKLRNEDRLGYASVAASAFYITIQNGEVNIDPSRDISELTGKGKQWASDKKFRKYVRLLNDFYQESNFTQFYNVQSQTYAEQIDKAGSLFDNINGEWFANFYDVEFVAPKVYIALGNGKHNYFVNGLDGSYDIVLGAKRYYLIDTLLPVIIHEICHKYSNPITDAMYSDIDEAFATFSAGFVQSAYHMVSIVTGKLGSADNILAEFIPQGIHGFIQPQLPLILLWAHARKQIVLLIWLFGQPCHLHTQLPQGRHAVPGLVKGCAGCLAGRLGAAE